MVKRYIFSVVPRRAMSDKHFPFWELGNRLIAFLACGRKLRTTNSLKTIHQKDSFREWEKDKLIYVPRDPTSHISLYHTLLKYCSQTLVPCVWERQPSMGKRVNIVTSWLQRLLHHEPFILEESITHLSKFDPERPPRCEDETCSQNFRLLAVLSTQTQSNVSCNTFFLQEMAHALATPSACARDSRHSNLGMIGAGLNRQ